MQPFRDHTTARSPLPDAEPPRSEPEIIPPGVDPSSMPRREPFVFADRGMRIEIRRPGPLGIALILLATVLIGALSLLVMAGAALIGVVAIGLGIAAAFFSRLYRGRL